MKTVVKIFSVLALSFYLLSCGGNNTPDVKLTPEMSDFISMIKGTSDDVAAALQKYGATEEIIENDMGMFNLESPVVTAKEGNCYTVEFKAGMTERVYVLCWDNGKIVKITDKGIKMNN